MLQVAIRADASPRIGIGHAMRCLTLARLFARHAIAEILFVCNRDLPEAVERQIVAEGFGLARAADADAFDWQADARLFLEAAGDRRFDWVVVDHYGVDRRWEEAVRPCAGKVLVIDDLANREHECDALLDQNLHADMEHRYRKLVPASCAQFLGPGHALLRDEFFAARKKAERKSRLRNVLVNFGGSDPTGETGKVLDALQQSGVPTGLCVHVVGGPANRRQVELRARCQSMPNVVFYPEMNRMADFLAGMDLAVGAGGVSLWERAFMGVPSAVIAVVDNQIPSAEEAARRDMIWYLGESRVVRPSQISELLRKLAEHPAELVRKSENSLLAMHTLRNVAKHPVIEYMLDECRKERSR